MYKLTKLFFAATILFSLSSCGNTENKIEKHANYTHSQADTTDNEWFIIDIDINLPTSQFSTANDIITKSLVEEFMGKKFAELSPSSIVDAYADTTYEYFRETNIAYQYEMDEMFDEDEDDLKDILKYEETLKIYPSHFIGDSIVSYVRELYIYQGGMHGLFTKIFAPFNIKTGQRIHLADLYPSKTDIEQLTDALHTSASKLRDEGKLPNEDDDFFSNELIEPSDNFYLTDSTAVFIYNPYEIAPYAYGLIEIPVKK